MLKLIYNQQIERIINLISDDSLNSLKTYINNNKIVETPFKVKISQFVFLCQFDENDKNDVYILAFKFGRADFNAGENIATINIIENHFLDQNIYI